MGVSLTACGSDTKPASSKVDCSKQAAQLKDANSVKEKAESKLKDVEGTPDEKQVKKDIEAAQATIDALNDCPSVKPSETAGLALSEKQSKQVAEDLSNIFKGFQPGQVKVGSDKIPSSPQERATVSFTKKTIETRKDLETFFASDLDLAKRAKARVVRNLRKHNVSEEEIKRAVTSGDRWVWVAPTVPSVITGTTYPSGDGIVKINEPRGVASNDAIWFYVTEDGHVYNDVSVRADCMNPEVTTVVPDDCTTTGNCPPPITCVRNCKPDCKPPYVPYEDRCVKPKGTNDPGGSGGNGSPAKQPVSENPQGPTSGAPTKAPPPVVRPTDHPDGGSGDGGAPGPTTPDDDSDSGQTTSPSPSPTDGPCSLIGTC